MTIALASEYDRRGWRLPERILGRPFADWEPCGADESETCLFDGQPASGAVGGLSRTLYARVKLSVVLADLPALRDEAVEARAEVVRAEAQLGAATRAFDHAQTRCSAAALRLWSAEKRVEAGR
jgi:hypothetical protein